MANDHSATIRPEQPSDTTAIRRLLEQSFPTSTEAELVDRLRAAGRLTVALVAEQADRVVGYLALSPTKCDGGGAGLGLGPVAVGEEFRGQGIAASLITAGLESCRGRAADWVVVLGEPQYYRRFGFERAADVGLSDEYDGGDAFQAKLLASHWPQDASGVVRYAPEFSIFEG